MNEEIKVLALKYRPKRFEDLVGQATISQTLSLALDSNRLSHAYLFSGLRGSGKTSTARIMAKAFLCTQGPTSKPCEVCENCQSANSNRHLDIIEMDAASNRGIDDIKDLIEHTKYKPSSARFKVFIIDEVHMLTTQAFNALLKTLEEPPGFVKFILATTDPLKLPATILSRTQHFRFKRIANKDVLHHLTHILNEEHIEFETDALDIITRSGQGSLRDTLTLLDQAIIFSKGKVTTTAVVDMLGLIDPQFMESIFDTVLSASDTTQIIHALEDYEAGQVCDEMTIYLKQKMLERDPKFDVLLFDRFFRIIADAKHLLALNSDPMFVIILMLSKMSEATNLKTIEEVINEVEALEVKESMKTCDASLTHAIESKTVIEHSHEANTDVVSQAAQEVYHEIPVEQNSVTVNEETVDTQETKIVPSSPFEEQETIIVNNTETVSQPAIEPAVEAVVEQAVETTTAPIVQESQESTETIASNPFETPFDMPTTPIVEPIVNEVVEPIPTVVPEVQNSIAQDMMAQIPTQTVEQMAQENSVENLTDTQIHRDINETHVAPEVSTSEPVKQEQTVPVVTPEQDIPNLPDPNKDKFELVINRVYDRDIELGEAFEDNFIYKTFENNELQIDSYAQGDTRKFLLKHYGIIKTFFYDVYGHGIELKFFTQEREKKSDEVVSVQPQETNVQNAQNENSTQEAANNNEAGSMIEDIEVGSGCVADMQKTANPAPAQQELQMQDILNSPMLNKAKELFDIKKITVKTKT